MVPFGESPCFDAAFAEVAGEGCSESVEGENPLRFDQIHIAQEIVVIGMIAEREGSVALIPIDRAGIQRPAGEDGQSSIANAADHGGTGGTWRADEDLSVDLALGVAHVTRGEFGFQLPIDLRHVPNAAVEHRGESGVEKCAEDFLRFTQRVTEQDRYGILRERLLAECDHLLHDQLRGRKAVAGKTVGGFHDKGLRVAPGAGFRAEARTQFEVTGIEESAGVGFEVELSGAEDVSGREQGDTPAANFAGFVEGQGVFDALSGHTGAHESGGACGQDDFTMGSGVITVGVGDEGERPRFMGIEPQIVVGKVETALVVQTDHFIQPGDAKTKMGW